MSKRKSTGVRGNYDAIRMRLRAFASERDWDKFHSPKNLSMALVVEAAELAEHFQWLSNAQSKRLPKASKAKVEEELADVFLYLIRLADKLEIDLFSAAANKININALKYPAHRVRGSSKKYSEYR